MLVFFIDLLIYLFIYGGKVIEWAVAHTVQRGKKKKKKGGGIRAEQ